MSTVIGINHSGGKDRLLFILVLIALFKLNKIILSQKVVRWMWLYNLDEGLYGQGRIEIVSTAQRVDEHNFSKL